MVSYWPHGLLLGGMGLNLAALVSGSSVLVGVGGNMMVNPQLKAELRCPDLCPVRWRRLAPV